MSHVTTDWAALERLRSRFLQSEAGAGAYWQDENELANYHAYFAARIGWKWDDALREASAAGFELQSNQLLDWGCGSGIATLRTLALFGSAKVKRVMLWDHSLVACRFAQKTIQAAHPEVEVEISPAPQSSADLRDTAILVSHALNELTLESRQSLSELARQADQALFVEPGNHLSSRLLGEQREALRNDFHIVAPCVHCQQCPMLSEDNARHWCHFFGKPPVEAFTEGDWSRFATMMEIDLRSLPYSFLALNNKRLAKPAALPEKPSRLIGRPRQFKGYTRLLSCDAAGLRELELQKRDDKALWKSLKKQKDGSLYHWIEIEGDRIKRGEPEL